MRSYTLKKVNLNSRHYVLFDKHKSEIIFMKAPKNFRSIDEYFNSYDKAYYHNLNGFSILEFDAKDYYIENIWFKEENYWNK